MSSNLMIHALSDPLWRFRLGALLLCFLMCVGTLGYILLGMTPFNAFYMTLVTVSTVGFSEIGGCLVDLEERASKPT